MEHFQTGKLPASYLEKLLLSVRASDPRVVRGGIFGEDAAVIDFGDRYLLAKSDPITFATDRPGWYAVQVNANDIAAMGGTCRWFLATLLFPEGQADEALVKSVFEDIAGACRELGIELVGGHTEITHGLDRLLIAGQMLGEADADRLCTKEAVRAGDLLLMTKRLAVEGTSLIARECRARAGEVLDGEELREAAGFLLEPGISVVREAGLASDTGLVHAMHDATEGGLVTAVREMASASDTGVALEVSAVPVYETTRRLCSFFGLDPLGLIASGSLLIACPREGAAPIREALEGAGIECTRIGEFVPREEGLTEVHRGRRAPLRNFDRDELCRLL